MEAADSTRAFVRDVKRVVIKVAFLVLCNSFQLFVPGIFILLMGGVLFHFSFRGVLPLGLEFL